ARPAWTASTRRRTSRSTGSWERSPTWSQTATGPSSRPDERPGAERRPQLLAPLLPLLGHGPGGPAPLRRDPADRPREWRARGAPRRGPGGSRPVPALPARPATPDDPGGQGRSGRGPLGADGRGHPLG